MLQRLKKNQPTKKNPKRTPPQQQQNPSKPYKTYDKKLSWREDVVKEVLAKSFSVAYCRVLTGTTTDRLMGLNSESRTRLEQEEDTQRWQIFCHKILNTQRFSYWCQ